MINTSQRGCTVGDQASSPSRISPPSIPPSTAAAPPNKSDMNVQNEERTGLGRFVSRLLDGIARLVFHVRNPTRGLVRRHACALCDELGQIGAVTVVQSTLGNPAIHDPRRLGACLIGGRVA